MIGKSINFMRMICNEKPNVNPPEQIPSSKKDNFKKTQNKSKLMILYLSRRNARPEKRPPIPGDDRHGLFGNEQLSNRHPHEEV